MAVRPVRLAALGLSHESNTFAPGRTGLERMEEAGFLRGDAIRERHAGGTSTMSGFLEVEGDGVTVVPLLHTFPVPGPMLDRDAYEAVVREMVAAVREGGPWDGVLLAQHGAAVADGQPDADAEVCRRIRAAVGPDVPIGLALDMHANLDAATVGPVDVTITYRSNPHLDALERAREVAELIVRAARGEVELRQAIERVPIAIGIAAQHTEAEPMAGLLRDLDRVLVTPGVLTASIAEGYQYADVAALGMSALVVSNGDELLAREAARWLAARIWDARGAMDPDRKSVV